jgi:hypothetical protein
MAIVDSAMNPLSSLSAATFVLSLGLVSADATKSASRPAPGVVLSAVHATTHHRRLHHHHHLTQTIELKTKHDSAPNGATNPNPSSH